MDYDFTFRFTTDRPLTDKQVSHVRSLGAHEIMESLGCGILNTEEEGDNAEEVRLTAVSLGDVHEIYSDGTNIKVL